MKIYEIIVLTIMLVFFVFSLTSIKEENYGTANFTNYSMTQNVIRYLPMLYMPIMLLIVSVIMIKWVQNR